MFEDRLHDLTYDVEDDKYWRKFYYINDMRLDWHYDLIHVDVNHPIQKKNNRENKIEDRSFFSTYFIGENCITMKTTN